MRTLGVIAALLAAVYLFFQVWDYSLSRYRYRLTIEIEVDGTTKSASSVHEAKPMKTWSIDVGSGGGTALAAEAVFVDLGSGRNVVALLAVGKDADRNLIDGLVPRAFAAAGNVRLGNSVDNWKWVATQTAAVELKSDNLPTLATVRDFYQPFSTEIVSPYQLPRVFGPGVHFKRALVQMTRDPVTRTIQKQIPGLANINVWNSKLPRLTMPGEFKPGSGLFIREE